MWRKTLPFATPNEFSANSLRDTKKQFKSVDAENAEEKLRERKGNQKARNGQTANNHSSLSLRPLLPSLRPLR
jgi:hypothetical protein